MNPWHGFLPNVVDTKILSSYVDENFSNGLKQNSKRYLEYEQADYKTTTTRRGLREDLPKGGRVIKTEEIDEQEIVTKQYRMNELTAKDVFDYGTDDTICTAALYNFYQIQLELENTDHLYDQVEQSPAYLTALAFVQGAKVSIERLKQLEKEDDAAFEEARTKMQKIMLDGGLIDAMWVPYTDSRCADFKAAFLELTGIEIDSKVRTHSKLAAQMRHQLNGNYENFIDAVEREDIDFVNQLLLEKFKKDPSIDMNSPKQMSMFMYDVLKLPVRVVNRPTDLERREKPEMADVVQRYLQAAMKGEEIELDDKERELLKSKAKTDDVAVDMAIIYDAETHPLAKQVLEQMKLMKTIITRRSLYYSKYPVQVHWKSKKVHSAMNQCAAVTRRYSSSGPNLQQLPKKGDGVKIRQIIVPHHKDAVVVSLDFSSQELRLAADQSRDENMLACYIGDNKKDVHSITASGAMIDRWGKEKVRELMEMVGVESISTPEEKYELFVTLHKEVEDKEVHKLADDLRKKSKNVNFLSQYDGQALTLSYQMLMPVHICQQFLDAKYAMFPKVETWKEGVREFVARNGYALTLLGARRHLAQFIFDRATAARAGRQGPNFVIQGSSAEQTKLAMGAVWESNVCYDYDCRFLAPIHDELVFSIHKDHVLPAVKIIHECMTRQYANMTVPCVSSISLGLNFGEQEECGDEYDAEKIQQVLDKVLNKETA